MKEETLCPCGKTGIHTCSIPPFKGFSEEFTKAYSMGYEMGRAQGEEDFKEKLRQLLDVPKQ